MRSIKTPLLGAHMSIAGGIDQAFYRGAEIKCTAIQIFTHSNRQWAMNPLTQKTVDDVAIARKKTGITECVVHASYLINLGSQTVETVKKSKEALYKELAHCETLSITTLVLHPGSGSIDPSMCINQISELIDEVFESTETSTTIALENMAGQGSQVGYKLEHLASIRNKSSYPEKIGFCLDTCHLWASGYDFSTKASYQKTIDEIDSLLGLTNIKAIHMNDSKKERGSRVDRHEDIGKGTIGLEAFTLLMNDERLTHIPKIIETPMAELEDSARNIEVLRSLIKNS
ncbi:deoxyribonuclease IV [Candidatus Dependentiae bacterium]|nr:deoxyribonuclease IV [Candidatus Dependentiae bacterium]